MTAEERRDQLWLVSMEVYYDTYYEELVALAIEETWASVATAASLLSALTSGGSAIAQWNLWTQPEWKTLWVFVSAVSAVLSLFAMAMSAGGKTKQWRKVRDELRDLRLDIEGMRQRMKLNTAFPVDELTAVHDELRARYKTVIKSVEIDVFRTDALRKRCQDDLNAKLGGQIR